MSPKSRVLTIAAVRGAISVPIDRAEAIREASSRLLRALIDANALRSERIVSAIFTATPDLTADFPAHAARLLGWTDVPLLGATEMAVPGAPKRLVRVLLTVRVEVGTKLVPMYLDEAARLRPDIAGRGAAKLGATKPPASHERTPGAGAVGRATVPRIALIGLGQIGGSLALALGRAGGWSRVGFDRDARVTAAVLKAGAIDVAAQSLRAACAQADLVVVAVPVDVLPQVLRAAARIMRPGATLLDTGSARAGLFDDRPGLILLEIK